MSGSDTICNSSQSILVGDLAPSLVHRPMSNFDIICNNSSPLLANIVCFDSLHIIVNLIVFKMHLLRKDFYIFTPIQWMLRFPFYLMWDFTHSLKIFLQIIRIFHLWKYHVFTIPFTCLILLEISLHMSVPIPSETLTLETMPFLSHAQKCNFPHIDSQNDDENTGTDGGIMGWVGPRWPNTCTLPKPKCLVFTGLRGPVCYSSLFPVSLVHSYIHTYIYTHTYI